MTDMASLFEGFEYDIFISYRQKDNKGSRWVSDFVDALKVELESTFKEDISIYFDENPHDGLLETHDVDASLREKLKCLIFIPIISRTYCDPKCFAWEHEFKAFVEQTSNDRFGLKIRLPNGNVSTRVLPVRIHELEAEDTRLCEGILGGIIRGVDFIYKSPGVNRPLLANEEHPKDNLNKTYYRDQINKVANAIDNIVRSLKHDISDSIPESDKFNTSPIKPGRKVTERIYQKFRDKKLRKTLLILSPLLIFIIVLYFVFRSFNLINPEKTIAFIPFRTSNNDTSLNVEGDYLIEAVNDRLNNISHINVIPSISTFQFRNTEKPLNVIGKELKTSYLVDGNIRRDGKYVKIWIELCATKDNSKLWSKTFIWDKNQTPQIVREIILVIVDNLDIKLLQEEEKQIKTDPSIYPEATLNYISANIDLKDAWFYYNYGDRMLDSTSFNSAIEKYSKVIKEDSLFAQAYAKRATAISWGFYVRQLDSSYIEKCRKDVEKAISINKDLYEVQIAAGFYYYYCDIDFEKSLYFFNRAIEMAPGNYQPVYYLSLVYRKMGKWAESLNLLHRVIKYNPQEALFLTNIGLTYDYLHKFDSAIIYHQKAIDLVPGWTAGYKNKIASILLNSGKTSEARKVLDDAIKKTGENMMEINIQLDIYDKNYSAALHEAELSDQLDFSLPGDRYLYLAKINSLLNKTDISREYYDKAIIELNKVLLKDPNNSKFHSSLGVAYAGLGENDKAIAEGSKAIKLQNKNNMDEIDMKVNFAQILTMIGDYDNAITNMAYLLNNPSFFSKEMLFLDPVWKPLMENKEIRARIGKYFKV
jgi:tetratricopeptide (TPR) repeat protein